MSLFRSMWVVCSGLRLQMPLAVVSNMTLFSPKHFLPTIIAQFKIVFNHYMSNDWKRILTYFSYRNTVFFWRQQHDRVEQFVPALRVSTICSAPHQRSIQLRDCRSKRRCFLSIFTQLQIIFWLLNQVYLWPLPPGPGTGVPFHWHGPGFAEVIYGKKVNDELFLRLFRFSQTQTCRQPLSLLKDHLLFIQRWFFYPPEQEPHFDRNRTTLSWVTGVYPNLPEDEAPLECTLRPGEVSTQVFYYQGTSATSEDGLGTLLKMMRGTTVNTSIAPFRLNYSLNNQIKNITFQFISI